MKALKKVFLFCFVVLGILLISGINKVFAASHPESGLHGFTVDSDSYDIAWDSRRTLNVYQNGSVKGTVTTYVGVAHSKYVISSGKRISTVMVRSIINPKKYTYTKQVLWWTETVTEYGAVDQISYEMDFDTTELIDVSPKNTPTSNTYSIGVNAGISASTSNGGTFGGSLGISASQTFTADALKIINRSDTSSNLAKTSFEYQDSIYRWNWERDSYNFYESEQKAAYSVGVTTRKYYYLIIFAEFNSKDTTPCYFQDNLNKHSSSSYHALIYV